MAQISRPFQIGLVAVVLLAGVWLFALRGHSQSSSEPSPAAPASSPSTSHAAPSAPSSSAPGVAGLSNDVAKARGAVATSEKNAHQLEQKSAQASGESASGASHTGASPAAGASALEKSQVAGRSEQKAKEAQGPAKSHATSPSGASAGKQALGGVGRQQEVEAKLQQGSVAVILFWDSHGADDKAVQRSLHLLASVHKFFAPLAKRPATQRLLKAHGLELDKSISVFEASAEEVASFGSITRGVQVYGTPTLVIVGPSRQAHVVTGFTDAYSIEQAIEEARNS
jgi:hypothetical protein